MFVKVQAEGPARDEILRAVEISRCRVVDVSRHNEMTIEATGDHTKNRGHPRTAAQIWHQGNSQDRALVAMRRSRQGILAVLSAQQDLWRTRPPVWRLSFCEAI